MTQNHPSIAGDDQTLSAAIEGAARSIHFFMTTPKGIGCYRAILERAKAGLAIDLIVPAKQLNKLGLTARYVEKLQAAGGRFFLMNLRQVNWQRIKLSSQDLLLIDDQTCWKPASGNDGWLAATDEPVVWQAQLQQLREAGEIPGGTTMANWFTESALTQSDGRREPNLSITFRADNRMVKTGDQIRLEWSVPGAKTVDLQPRPGHVPVSGSRSVRITASTEFTLTARRGNATISKVLAVNIDQRVGLKYWLRADDMADPKRSFRLEEQPDLPGHFGVLQGLQVTLHWETVNALAIRLNGAQVTASGERSFTPADLTTVNLEAVGILGDELERPIIIKVFTPRVAVPDLEAPADFFPVAPQRLLDLQGPDHAEPSRRLPREHQNDGHEKLMPEGQSDSVGKGVLSRLNQWFKSGRT